METNAVLLSSGMKVKRWIPKKWKPIHYDCVSLHASGLKNKEIAERLGKTEVWVSLVLNTPQASLMLRDIFDRLEKNIQKNIETNLSVAATKAAERIRDFVMDDDKANNMPVAMVDRSFKILQSLGKIIGPESKTGTTVNARGPVFVMSPESATEISTALRLAAEVDRKHLGTKQEIIVDAPTG